MLGWIMEQYAIWESMASMDGAVAHTAKLACEDQGAAAVAFIKEHLSPDKEDKLELLERIVLLLEDEEFDRRQDAQRRMCELAITHILELQKRAEAGHGAELKYVLRSVIDRGRRGAMPFAFKPDLLRAIRAVQVLERLGTPEAKELLGTLGSGYPRAWLTLEAKAALARLQE